MMARTGEPDLRGESAEFGMAASSISIVDTKPSMLGRLGVVAVALALAGGGAFAITKALSAPTGPQSPSEAVDEFFAAIDNDDLLGIADLLLPSERESLVEPGLDLLVELQRLEIVEADVDPEALRQFDFSVSGLEVSTSEIGTGVARARITGGTISVEGDKADMPVGDVVIGEMGEAPASELFFDEFVDFGENEVALAIVEEDGSWYVSLWYSVAEAVRDETGHPVPDFGNGVTPIGADTPEAAVESLVEALVDLDVERAIGMLDPSEFRALYDYAPLFLDDAATGVAEIRSQADEADASWSLDRLDLSSSQIRGRTVVTFQGIAASASVEGESFTFDMREGCVEVNGPELNERVCEDDATGTVDLPASLDKLRFDEGGITIVERDGRWFVSGVPTMLGYYTDLLAALEPADVQAMIDEFADFTLGIPEDLFGYGFGESDGEEMFDSTFGELGTTGDEEGFGTVDNGEGFEDVAAVEISAEDLVLFPTGTEAYGNDPEWYYGFERSIQPLSYSSAFDADSNFLEIARFPAGSNSTLIADLEADDRYQLSEIDGLPAGATAFVYDEVDVMVVYGDLVISTWLGSGLDHLVGQVQYLAGS